MSLALNAWNGYFDKATGSIGWASLSNTAVVVGGDLASYVNTSTSQGIGGTGRPAPNAGTDVGYIGLVTFSGLAPATTYTWSITQGGNTVNGTVTTMPQNDSTNFTIYMSTCDNPQQFMVDDPYRIVRERAEAASNPLAFVLIDDISYIDNQHAADPDTGLIPDVPYVDATEYSYALAWLVYLGILDNHQDAATPPLMYNTAEDADRLWVYRNLQRWVQWGDHEVAPDYGRAVEDASTTSSGRDPALLPIAKLLYETCMGACIPPYLGNNALIPPSTGSGQAWGFDIGPVRVASYDCNTFSQPYNAYDALEGSSRTYGRAGTFGSGTVTGSEATATTPSKTEINTEFGTTGLNPTQYLGEAQVETILDHYVASNAPFKWLFASNGISSKNEPWADRWPDEFDRFINGDDASGTRTAGVFQQPAVSGQGGQLTVFKGDSHSREVNKYEGDSTLGSDSRPVGLGGADGYELWEFNPGTINGSWAGNTLGNIYQGGTRVYGLTNKELWQGGVKTDLDYDDDGNGRVLFASFLEIEVNAFNGPRSQTVRMVDSSDGTVIYSATQYENQGNNSWEESRPMPYFGLKKETNSPNTHAMGAGRADSTNNNTEENGVAGLVFEELGQTVTVTSIHVRGASQSGVNPTAPCRVRIWDANNPYGTPAQRRPTNGEAPLYTSADFTFPAGTSEGQIDLSGVNFELAAGVWPLLTVEYDSPGAGESAPNFADAQDDFANERFTITTGGSIATGPNWGSGGGNEAVVAWAEYSTGTGGTVAGTITSTIL